MAINPIIKLEEGTKLYNAINSQLDNATDKDLIIVAKSEKNRKGDLVPPISVRYGIYFYVAYDMEGMTAYVSKPTLEQILKARTNMAQRARIGDMFDFLTGGDQGALDSWNPGEDKEMLLLTTANKTYGAGILYCEDILESIREKVGDYYILPSSIHELLVIPKREGVEIDALTDMVRFVNDQEVTEDLYLADRAFKSDEWI